MGKNGGMVTKLTCIKIVHNVSEYEAPLWDSCSLDTSTPHIMKDIIE